MHDSDVDAFFTNRDKNVHNFETLLELQAYKGEYQKAIDTIAVMKVGTRIRSSHAFSAIFFFVREKISKRLNHVFFIRANWEP